MNLTVNTQNPIRLVLISGSSTLRDRLREELRGSEYELGLEFPKSAIELGGEELSRLRAARPEVVVLELGSDPEDGIRFVQHLALGDPSLQIVAVGPTPTPEFLLDAMRAGVTEYLTTTATDGEIAGVLGRLARKLRRGAEVIREPAKVYTLVSAKGGAGKTTAATNLAVELHRLSGKRTLLIDLELEFGETGLMLGLQPRFSLLDLVKNFHRMDANLLSSYIERHESGIELLAAPASFEGHETLSREEVRTVLHFLKKHYDQIVVDTPKSISPAALAAIEESDQIIVLTTPDLPALRNTKRWLPLLEAHFGGRTHGGRNHQAPAQGGSNHGGPNHGRGAPAQPDRIRLLVNRYSPENVITLEDISRTLGLPVSWRLSSDYESISNAINRGEPVVLDGGSRYARDMRAFSTELSGLRTGSTSEGRGPLARAMAPLRGLLRRILPARGR